MSYTAHKTAGPQVLTLADIKAYETTPLRQRYPWESSYDLIVQSGHRYGRDVALEFLPTAEHDETGIKVSFSQLAERVHQTANLFHSLGVGPGDTISLLLPSLLETHYALWGGQAAGIVSPINPLLGAGHIIEIMNETRSKVLVSLARETDVELWSKVEKIIEQVPSLETLLLVDAKDTTELKCSSDVRVLSFSSAIADQPADRLVSGRAIKSDDIAAYFHTGGTTGRPKVAQLTHGNIAFVSQVYADRSSDQGRFAMLCALPLFHIYGTVAAGIATLFAGRTVVIMTASGFRSPNVLHNWWHHIARFQVKFFAAVPTILNALLEVPIGDNDISCLVDVGSGAAPLSDNLKLAFEKKFSVRITNGYGMTESCCLLARPLPEHQPPRGSVGTRLPYMEMQTAHVDGDRLVKTCEPGEVGVVLARGPHIFAGYLNPVDNAKAWVDHSWFNTGDMGYMDNDGNLFLTGRAKDLIIRGGHNIDPVLIEEPLAKHPAVAMAVAVGQPDAYAGEIPVAYVTLNQSVNSQHKITEAKLIEYCRETISERAAIPKRIEIIDEIPLTAVAKVFKPALRNRATEYVVSQALSQADIEAGVAAEFDPKLGQVAKVQLHKKAQQRDALVVLEALPIRTVFV